MSFVAGLETKMNQLVDSGLAHPIGNIYIFHINQKQLAARIPSCSRQGWSLDLPFFFGVRPRRRGVSGLRGTPRDKYRAKLLVYVARYCPPVFRRLATARAVPVLRLLFRGFCMARMAVCRGSRQYASHYR